MGSRLIRAAPQCNAYGAGVRLAASRPVSHVFLSEAVKIFARLRSAPAFRAS